MNQEELSQEWKEIRRGLGNLICHIDGQMVRLEKLGELEEAYEKGVLDAQKGFAGIAESNYQRGLQEGWDLARKIENEYGFGEIESQFNFDVGNIFDIPARGVMEKVRAYEERKKSEQEFKLGDEVEANDGNEWIRFIVAGELGDETIIGFDSDGGLFEYPKSACRKTGKKFQINAVEK